MGYRTLKIDGDEYQFSAGKTHVHIKGGRLKVPLNFQKRDVGEKVEWTCECCGEPLSKLGYTAEETSYSYAITPAVVRNLVVNHLSRDT